MSSQKASELVQRVQRGRHPSYVWSCIWLCEKGIKPSEKVCQAHVLENVVKLLKEALFANKPKHVLTRIRYNPHKAKTNQEWLKNRYINMHNIK